MNEKVIIRTNNDSALSTIKFFITSIIFFLITFGICEYFNGGLFEGRYEFYFPHILASVGVALIPFIVLWILKLLVATELVVTDKRVYGAVAFGKRVDLPLDSITAIALTVKLFQGISISTSSGRITFYFIETPEKFHKEINDLIIERQSKNTTTIIEKSSTQSSADELRKYKDLLDSGVITQEEFDAKKKQLLGL